MKDKPFALIGVNSDRDREKLKQIMQEKNITWRSFWNGGSTRGPISTAWGVRGWPTIYVIDDRGVIRYKNVRGEAMDKAVDELIEKSIVLLARDLQSEDPKVKGLAAFRMGKYNAPKAKTTLAGLLESKEPIVRRRAATGLALLGEPLKPLLSLLRQAVTDEEPKVRADSLKALGKAGDKQATPLAIQALQDKDVDVRRVAVATLGDLKDPAATLALAKAVDDSDLETAQAAAFSLAKLESPQSTALLKKLAANSEHPVRVSIAVALHSLGETGTGDRFKQLLGDEEVTVRRRAATALDTLSKFDATDLYIQALEDKDSQVRKVASTALSQSKLPRAIAALKNSLVHQIDELLPLLSGRDYRKRSQAIKDLKELGPAAAPLLLDQLDNAPSQSRFSLAMTIGQLGNPAVIPPTLEKLKNPKLSTTLRYSYESVLRYMRDKGRAAIDELVQDEQPVVRESGVRLLSGSSDAEAVKSLKAALKDSSSRVRVYAAMGLARRKDQDALAVLKDSAKDNDRQVRSLSASALRSFDAKTALPLLTELVKDSDRSVRYSAVYALGNFKEEQATQAIVEACKKDTSLWSPAISVLQRQNTPVAARALGEFLKDKNSSIQQRARSALKRMRTPEAKKVLEKADSQKDDDKKDGGKKDGDKTRAP